jgi:hypothetical protein
MEVIIQEFLWSEWGNLRNHSVSITNIQVDIQKQETGTFPLNVAVRNKVVRNKWISWTRQSFQIWNTGRLFMYMATVSVVQVDSVQTFKLVNR